jgi:hypothetical protein
MRVNASARTISAANPGISHKGLLWSRSQAQNAKHPPISPIAASAYQSSEVILKVLSFGYELASRGLRFSAVCRNVYCSRQ